MELMNHLIWTNQMVPFKTNGTSWVPRKLVVCLVGNQPLSEAVRPGRLAQTERIVHSYSFVIYPSCSFMFYGRSYFGELGILGWPSYYNKTPIISHHRLLQAHHFLESRCRVRLPFAGGIPSTYPWKVAKIAKVCKSLGVEL